MTTNGQTLLEEALAPLGDAAVQSVPALVEYWVGTEPINVLDDDYAGGADRTGVTDSSAAFNAAFDALRANSVFVVRSTRYNASRIVIPPGVYRIETPIDATGIRDNGWRIEGKGAVLLGHTTGKPVIDFIYSRGGYVDGLTIVGDETNRPEYAFQIGRKAQAEGASSMHFYGINGIGFFSGACVLNHASEIVTMIDCVFQNSDATASSYCLVQDGSNSFGSGIESDYQNVTVSQGDTSSFIQNHFFNCEFRKIEGGPTVWMRDLSQHRYHGCYMISVDDHTVVVDGSAFGIKDLYLDVHYETSGAKSCVRFEGTAPAYTVSGLTVRDSTPLVSDEILSASASNVITLHDLEIDLVQAGGVSVPQPANGLMSPIAQFKLTGRSRINTGSTEGMMTAPLRTMGELSVPDRDTEVFGPGSQLIWDSTNTELAMKGELRVYSDPASTVAVAGLATGQKECRIGGGIVGVGDAVTAPSAVSGLAQIYVDSADNDLKVIFGDGTIVKIGDKP